MGALNEQWARRMLESIIGCMALEEEMMAAILIIDSEQRIVASKVPRDRSLGILNLEIAMERLRGAMRTGREGVGRVIIWCPQKHEVIGAVGISLRGEHDDENVNLIVEAGIQSVDL